MSRAFTITLPNGEKLHDGDGIEFDEHDHKARTKTRQRGQVQSMDRNGTITAIIARPDLEVRELRVVWKSPTMRKIVHDPRYDGFPLLQNWSDAYPRDSANRPNVEALCLEQAADYRIDCLCGETVHIIGTLEQHCVCGRQYKAETKIKVRSIRG